MRSKRTINEASKHMTIEQLKRIVDNGYRSECLHYDYDQQSIDKMLARKQTERNERQALEAINELDAYECVERARMEQLIESKLEQITNLELRQLWRQELLGE